MRTLKIKIKDDGEMIELDYEFVEDDKVISSGLLGEAGGEMAREIITRLVNRFFEKHNIIVVPIGDSEDGEGHIPL